MWIIFMCIEIYFVNLVIFSTVNHRIIKNIQVREIGLA